MKFIRQCDNSTDVQDQGITDGQNTCAYGQIPGIFDNLQDFFIKKGIGIEAPLVLECENSLNAALILLYLLEKDYSFLLIPPEKNASETPAFCRFRMKTGGDRNAPDPDAFLHIAENRQWNGKCSDPGDAKLYLRTSGSTGIPKLAVHSHIRLRQNALNCLERLGLDSSDRVAVPVPVFHMFGLGAAFLPSVIAGANIDLQKGANVLTYMQRERIFIPNAAFMTPIFCENLLKVRKSSRAYRLTVTAGDRFRGEGSFAKYESFFGCTVNLYGSTEMGAISASHPTDSFSDRSETAGRPMNGVQMRIKEDKAEMGELWCRHESGFYGYADTEGNALALSPENREGWFSTRDMGRIRADGRIQIMGRCDHSVNRDGLLVFFADVEKAMKTIKGIESVVVVSKGETSRGKGIVACCAVDKKLEIKDKDIRNACFEILPARAVPDEIVIFENFPMLASGKVDRQRIGQMV